MITDFVIGQTFRLSLLPRSSSTPLAIFLLPSLVLGMVSPLVVKLALADLQRTGNTVGTIYAFSTAGSIVGTFLTGFWLISWLGTRSIVWIVAGVLLITGLAIGEFHRSRGLGRMAAGLLAPVLAFATFAFVRVGWSAGKYRAPCEVESNYYCIQINETFENGRPARALMLDQLIHSFVVLDDPTALGYGYERAYADLTRCSCSGRQQIHTLFIGGGGYAFPRYVEAAYPKVRDGRRRSRSIPAVIAGRAQSSSGLGATSRIRSFNQDARTFLMADRTGPDSSTTSSSATRSTICRLCLSTSRPWSSTGIVQHRHLKPERDLPRERHRQVSRAASFSRRTRTALRVGLPARLPVLARGERVPAAVRSQHVRADGERPAAEFRRLRGDHIHRRHRRSDGTARSKKTGWTRISSQAAR